MSDDGSTFTPAAPKASRSGMVSASTSATMVDMIQKARAAFYAKQDKKGYYIGGKTGTSQTLQDGKYVDNQSIGTYLGFGGTSANDLKYVIMVQVSGKGMNLAGDKDALPIFTDISNWLLDYMKLQPKG
jgi:cell division protein FtsI/penicillin-binding protein 2